MDAHARTKRSLLKLVRSEGRTAQGQAGPARARDARVERAIELMKGRLDERWTVTKLARSVGLSRPAFARRFTSSMGSSPLRYLTRCRMEQAAELLRTSEAGLAQVAAQVGYDSEFAFNRAFKRFHHVAPGTFRRQVAFGSAPVFRAAA